VESDEASFSVEHNGVISEVLRQMLKFCPDIHLQELKTRQDTRWHGRVSAEHVTREQLLRKTCSHSSVAMATELETWWVAKFAFLLLWLYSPLLGLGGFFSFLIL
jgi:hypothetical protein